MTPRIEMVALMTVLSVLGGGCSGTRAGPGALEEPAQGGGATGTEERRGVVSLIVATLASEPPSAGVGNVQKLVRIDFREGAHLGTETVLTTKTDELRFDVSTSRIYRDRYVVTDFGDIVDVASTPAKVVHRAEPGTEFLAFDGQKVVLRRRHVSDEGYYTFDLDQGRYLPLDQPGPWALPGVLSPDKTMSMSFEGGAMAELFFNRVGGPRRSLGAGFGYEISLMASPSHHDGPPLLWLDDQSALTQRSNGELVSVSIDGSVQPVATIAISEAPLSEPSLARDPEGQIIYTCGESHVVDVPQKISAVREWRSVGDGFSLKVSESRECILRDDSGELGGCRCIPWDVEAVAGYVAMPCQDVPTNALETNTIRVWSREAGGWRAIEVSWISQIIGWITG